MRGMDKFVGIAMFEVVQRRSLDGEFTIRRFHKIINTLVSVVPVMQEVRSTNGKEGDSGTLQPSYVGYTQMNKVISRPLYFGTEIVRENSASGRVSQYCSTLGDNNLSL